MPETFQHGEKQEGAAAGASLDQLGPETARYSRFVRMRPPGSSLLLQTSFPQGLRQLLPLSTDTAHCASMGGPTSSKHLPCPDRASSRQEKVLTTVPSFIEPRSSPEAWRGRGGPKLPSERALLCLLLSGCQKSPPRASDPNRPPDKRRGGPRDPTCATPVLKPLLVCRTFAYLSPAAFSGALEQSAADGRPEQCRDVPKS